MEKKIYKKPLMRLINLNQKDVIATSTTQPGPGTSSAPERRGTTIWDD